MTQEPHKVCFEQDGETLPNSLLFTYDNKPESVEDRG